MARNMYESDQHKESLDFLPVFKNTDLWPGNYTFGDFTLRMYVEMYTCVHECPPQPCPERQRTGKNPSFHQRRTG